VAPIPGWVSVQLHGDPLHGGTIPVDLGDPDPGVALVADGCSYLGGRSWYEPDATGTWCWSGDTP